MKNRWLFIHGGWGGSWQWTPLTEQLTRKNIPFSAPDLPGMGESNNSNTSLTEFVKYTSAIIENSSEPINLAAFSFGGMTATALAGKYPHKIDKLYYIDAFVPDPGQSFTEIAGTKITRQINAYSDVMGEDNMIPPFFETDQRYCNHPLQTLFSTVNYKREDLEKLNPVYIECTAKNPLWTFTSLLEKTVDKIKKNKWTVHAIDSDHMPMYSHTNELCSLLKI